MPQLNVGSNQCVCRACGEAFFAVGTFDKHQSIKTGKLVCLTPEQMTARGWYRSKRGFWAMPAETLPMVGGIDLEAA